MKRPFHLVRRPNTDYVWMDSSTTPDQIMDHLETMRRMETGSYQRCDYLKKHYSPSSRQQQHQKEPHDFHHWFSADALYVLGTTPATATHSNTKSRNKPHSSVINEATRYTMVSLLYEIADYCHFRRETVAYAVCNVMDRYLSLPSHRRLQSMEEFQLLASASLFIAVKVLEPVSMDVQSLADLSRGGFDAQDVLDMEKTILLALQWNVAQGPTPIAYVQHYLTLLQMEHALFLSNSNTNSQDKDTGEDIWDAILEQAQYQVELSVTDYSLVAQQNPSKIALASVWNALEAHLSCQEAMQWQRQLGKYLVLVGIAPSSSRLIKLQLALCKLQYNADLHFQQQEQHHQSSTSSESSNRHHVSYQEQEAPDSFEESAIEPNMAGDEDCLDVSTGSRLTDEEEDEEETPHFPSPTSVMASQMSAPYDGGGKDADTAAADKHRNRKSLPESPEECHLEAPQVEEQQQRSFFWRLFFA